MLLVSTASRTEKKEKRNNNKPQGILQPIKIHIVQKVILTFLNLFKSVEEGREQG